MMGVVGQEGQMVGVVGQDADGREPDGTGSWDQKCQMAREGGDGREKEGQMVVDGGGGAGGPDGRGGGAGC